MRTILQKKPLHRIRPSDVPRGLSPDDVAARSELVLSARQYVVFHRRVCDIVDETWLPALGDDWRSPVHQLGDRRFGIQGEYAHAILTRDVTAWYQRQRQSKGKGDPGYDFVEGDGHKVGIKTIGSGSRGVPLTQKDLNADEVYVYLTVRRIDGSVSFTFLGRTSPQARRKLELGFWGVLVSDLLR